MTLFNSRIIDIYTFCTRVIYKNYRALRITSRIRTEVSEIQIISKLRKVTKFIEYPISWKLINIGNDIAKWKIYSIFFTFIQFRLQRFRTGRFINCKFIFTTSARLQYVGQPRQKKNSWIISKHVNFRTLLNIIILHVCN